MATSDFPFQTKLGLLTYNNSLILLDAPRKEISAQWPILKDNFWKAVNRLRLTATPSFEDTEEDEDHHNITSLKIMLKETV